METAKKFYAQAQRMTIGMAAAVVVYGAMGYYLVQMGKAGPAILTASVYPLVKYGALGVSLLGVFSMWQLSTRMFSAFTAQASTAERPPENRRDSPVPGGGPPEKKDETRPSSQGGPPQKLFVRTVLMSAGAELPVLLGLVLVFLGRRPYDYVPFAVISLAGFALAFPRKQQWVSWLGEDF